MIALLTLIACGDKGDPVDSAETLAFHGQAWLVEPAAYSWGACTDGDEAIPSPSCWVCIELADDGVAYSWWGREIAGDAPWLETGSAVLGPWEVMADAVDVTKYDVSGARWGAVDYSNAAPWEQTASVTIGNADPVHAWQGSATWPDGVCSWR